MGALIVAYLVVSIVLGWVVVAAYDQWEGRVRLGNGGSVRVTCGTLEDGNGRLTYSPGVDPNIGVVRCQIDRR